MADFQCPAFCLFLQPLAPRVYGCSLNQRHGLSLHCPPCSAMLCPPHWQLLTQTAQHGVLGQKDALALTLLGELGRSAPELAGPRSRQ